MEQSLIDLCQRHLVHALQARIDSTEQAVSVRFDFEIIKRGSTAAFLAHKWPHEPSALPFNRIFHYSAPQHSETDNLLARLADERIDAIVEVLPGSHAAHTTTTLQNYGYRPVWQIPWFYLPVQEWNDRNTLPATLHRTEQTELPELAKVLIQAYGYTGQTAAAWKTLAQHGYSAPGFSCFLATIDSQPAGAGIVHLTQDSALVDGAATLPAYRGQGIQKALLAARLRYAKERGIIHAFSRTGAGSISQANLQTVGMRLLVESTAWRRTTAQDP